MLAAEGGSGMEDIIRRGGGGWGGRRAFSVVVESEGSFDKTGG